MTNRRFRSLGRYVGDLANELGLRDWRIEVHEAEPPANAAATTECIYARRIAHICIGEAFLHSPPEEQRIVVLHELLHVALWATDQSVRDTYEVLGHEARAVAESQYNTVREYAVDHLATALAPKFPLWEG